MQIRAGILKRLMALRLTTTSCRPECKAKWAAETQARLEKRAEQHGCPGNVELVQYIEALEHRFDRLVERLECVETGMGSR